VSNQPLQADQGIDGGGLRALLEELRPDRRPLGLALILGGLAAAASLAQPLATARLIDAITADERLLAPLVLLVALFVADTLLSASHGFLLERTGEGAVMRIRLGLVHGLLHMPLRELDRRRRGDLLARVSSDTTLLRSVVTSGFSSVVSAALFLIGAVVIMALLDIVLLAIVAGALVAAGAGVLIVSTSIRSGTEEAQSAVAGMTSPSSGRWEPPAPCEPAAPKNAKRRASASMCRRRTWPASGWLVGIARSSPLPLLLLRRRSFSCSG